MLACATIRRAPNADRAERPDGVVVGEDEVPEGELADLGANDVDPSPRHHRGGAGLDREDRIGADDAADVRVALRGVGEDAIGQLLERGFLLGQVGRARERLRHGLMVGDAR